MFKLRCRISCFYLSTLIFSLSSFDVLYAQTEEEKKAKEEGRKTAAESGAIVGLNKGVVESSQKSVKELAAARGINAAVFENKNPNETIDMITYKIEGGHIVEAKDTIQKQRLRKQYDEAYEAALKDRKELVEAEFQRDRASTEAERMVNARESKREEASDADRLIRRNVGGALLDKLGDVQKDYIRVQEQAQHAADRFAEAQAAYTAAQEKADASKTRLDGMATAYIQGNLEINKEEIRLMKAAEAEVAAENAPAKAAPAGNAPQAAPAENAPAQAASAENAPAQAAPAENAPAPQQPDQATNP